MDFLPSPADIPLIWGILGRAKWWSALQPWRRLFSALLFKIQADHHVGKIYFVRVYSGMLRTGANVPNASRGCAQRVGRLFQVHANERIPVEELGTGEVGALGGWRKPISLTPSVVISLCRFWI